MNLLLIREQFFKDTTIGKLYINGEFFCYTLEDAIRGYGIKVYGHTGIPAGAYKIDLSVSHRFKRLMPMVYTEPNKYEVKAGGIEFKGIRIHKGNNNLHTHGCILVGYKTANAKIWESVEAEKDLTDILSKSKDPINLVVKNR